MSAKRIIEGGVSLIPEPSKKKKTTSTPSIDYTKCIVCQHSSVKPLRNITSSKELILAMNARQDDTYIMLCDDVEVETWLEDKGPKWHDKCRNWYTNKKSYTYAQTKLHQKDSVQPECSTSSGQPHISTRQNTPTFKSKNTCVICNKKWYRCKKPTGLVSTKNSQNAILAQAQRLGREDIMLRLIGPGHDMMANDICYHKPCINKFKAIRTLKGRSAKQTLYDVAFTILIQNIEGPLFNDKCGFLIKSLRDQYRAILQELQVKNADDYRANTLKWKLKEKYGKSIAIISQACGSGFICESTIPLGDALEKLRHLEEEKLISDDHRTLQRAAKILRNAAKQCKQGLHTQQSAEISFSAAEKMVPDKLFNFTSMLLSEKAPDLLDSGRVKVESAVKEKALIMSQQILQHTFGIPTPLGIATTHYVLNQTRSKSLITLNIRLGQGISYERMHRQLTLQCVKIMQQVEEVGVYIPENMSNNRKMPHVFAMDNLDWKKKTLEGGSFNATTATIIETPDSSDNDQHAKAITISTSTPEQRKTLPSCPSTSIPPIHISAKDRQISRSLGNIVHVDSLHTQADRTAEDMLLVYRLGRVATTSQLIDIPCETESSLPGCSAFCARLHPHNQASKIGYLPLIPASPTNPAVLKEEMTRLVKTSCLLGDRWTVITGDQATYEAAVAIRDKYKDEFSNVVLLLSGFHQVHNYVKAICKITRDSGAEDILVAAGLCQEGTANKMFGEKADYYQTMHAIRILSEAMWRLFWKAFETWVADKDMEYWISSTETVVKTVIENKINSPEQLLKIQDSSLQLAALHGKMLDFQRTLEEHPTAVFWCNFLEMSDILHRFIYHQREGNWLGHLCESAKMLPYLIAAGHYKYGQQSLPLYFSEMKKLPENAPDVYEAMLKGGFVGRRADGHHNGVSPDMLLEQTYNADAKEESGLDGITLNDAARTKWVYTKPVTAAISAELKSMMHMNTYNPHHESGNSRVARDSGMILKVMAAVETNPFTSKAETLLNIATGQFADQDVKEDLLNVKELGLNAYLPPYLVTTQTPTLSNLKPFTLRTRNQKNIKRRLIRLARATKFLLFFE